jgi:membrane protein YdbS with pleckstrin-like domain
MTGDPRALDPAFVPAQRVSGWIACVTVMSAWAAALVVVLLMGEAVRPLVLWGVAALGVLLAPLLVWLAIAWPALAYRHWSYRLDEQGIEIRSGVVFRRVTTVPRSRVQHTDVSQGPIERRYGLGTLVIYTAGTEYARVDLPGLAHATATAVRDALLPKDGVDAV